MTFSPPHGSSTSMPSTMSRLRGTSSTFPPGLDLRNQYRALPGHLNSPHSPATSRGGSFAGAFTGGYASAPLTAPVDFSLPRTPVDGGHGNRDFNIPQLSAPMAPPNDFSNAYNNSLSPSRGGQDSRDFGSQNNGDSGAQTRTGSQGPEHGQNQHSQHNQQNRSQDDSYHYETGQKRKRSFTLSGGGYESP